MKKFFSKTSGRSLVVALILGLALVSQAQVTYDATAVTTAVDAGVNGNQAVFWGIAGIMAGASVLFGLIARSRRS